MMCKKLAYTMVSADNSLQIHFMYHLIRKDEAKLQQGFGCDLPFTTPGLHGGNI